MSEEAGGRHDVTGSGPLQAGEERVVSAIADADDRVARARCGRSG